MKNAALEKLNDELKKQIEQFYCTYYDAGDRNCEFCRVKREDVYEMKQKFKDLLSKNKIKTNYQKMEERVEELEIKAKDDDFEMQNKNERIKYLEQ